MARLKAGPTHVMDIIITIVTVAVGIFFVAVVLFNIPWGSILGRKRTDDVEEEEDQEESEDKDEESENQREKIE